MDKIVPNVPLTYLEVPFKSTWQVTINAFRVGEKPTFPNGAKSAYYHPEKVAYLDTFSPHIQLPSSLAATLFADFFHEIQGIKQEDDVLMGPCDLSLYQSINLFINDRFYVRLVPESFVIDIGHPDRCFIPFSFNQDDAYILGEPFFRNFYSVFDDSRGIVGIAPSVNFVHAGVVEGIVPNDEMPHPKTAEELAEEHKQQGQVKPQQQGILGTLYFVKDQIASWLSGIFGGASGGSSPSGNEDSANNTGIIILVVVLVVACCGGSIYLVTNFINFSASSNSMANKKEASRKVKSEHDDGVSLSSLLTRQDIEDRIREVKSSQPLVHAPRSLTVPVQNQMDY